MAAIAWPVVTNFSELKTAMRNGFDLVLKPDSILFALSRGAEYATPDKLHQHVAVKASQVGFVAFSAQLPDGGRLYKLTTRASDDKPAPPATTK